MLAKTLTLINIKICDFPFTFYDITGIPASRFEESINYELNAHLKWAVYVTHWAVENLSTLQCIVWNLK